MIVVPTPELDSPAYRALQIEGVYARTHPPQLREVLTPAPYDYGCLFADLWNAGGSFVVCEWDIIPFPGAVYDLLECPEPWCTHRYPLHQGNLTTSFGIGKYRPPKGDRAPLIWRETPWHLLDSAVLPVLKKRLSVKPHVHEPPVAHARRP